MQRRIGVKDRNFINIGDAARTARLHHDAALHLELEEVLVHVLDRDVQERLDGGPEFRKRQIAVAVALRHAERVLDAGLDAEGGILGDAGVPRDLVAGPEAEALDVLREAVRVVADDVVHLVAVAIIDLAGEVDGDAVFLEEHDGVLHVALRVHGGGDVHRLPRGDALDLGEALRLLLDDAHGVVTELLHDAGGHRGTDTLDGAGAEVAFDGFLGLRRDDLVLIDDELGTINLVGGLVAIRLYILACLDARQRADEGIGLALHHARHHGVARRRTLENDMIDVALKIFQVNLLYKKGQPK